MCSSDLKLAIVKNPNTRKLLEERIIVTFIFADLAVVTLKKFLPDHYIESVIGELARYKEKWEEYKRKREEIET